MLASSIFQHLPMNHSQTWREFLVPTVPLRAEQRMPRSQLSRSFASPVKNLFSSVGVQPSPSFLAADFGLPALDISRAAPVCR